MLEIHSSIAKNAVLWTVTGRLDGAGAVVFNTTADTLAPDTRYVMADVNGLDYLASVGIRSLLLLERKLKAREGGLILIGVTPFVEQVLDLSGLTSHFRRAASIEEATGQYGKDATSDGLKTRSLNGRDYKIQTLSSQPEALREWGSRSDKPDSFVPHIGAHLNEMGLSFGLGGLGIDQKQAEAGHGMLFSTGRLLAIQTADGSGMPDYLQAVKPEETVVQLSSAFSVVGAPALAIHGPDQPVALADLIRDLLSAADQPPLLAWLIAADADAVEGRIFQTAEQLSAGQATATHTDKPCRVIYLGIASAKDLGWPEGMRQAAGDAFFTGCASWFESTQSVPAEWQDALAQADALEELNGVGDLAATTALRNVRAWVFLPPSIESAHAHRLEIVVKEGKPLPGEWDAIARRIYHDASQLELTPLSGGFSATTYQATSVDLEGRRQLPTVLKISTLDFAEREEKAYHRYVEKFILNNSTVIMGCATRGTWSGLRYNFLGINGPESRLSWLTHHYRRRPAEELKPIFEHLFLRILHPWYGQAREQPVALFQDHNPTHLFRGLLDTARTVMGIDPDAPRMPCPPLGRDLPNPYHALKTLYETHADWTIPWFNSITHGDLNMQNILLDEKENLYVIDFSETRPRNVYADFARLEPIFKFEMTEAPDEAELARRLRFDEALYQVAATDEAPPLLYDGTDPMITKAHAMITLLRGLACTYTPGRSDLGPYLIALLEWTLPIIFYAQLPHAQKQYAAYSAGLIWERLQALDVLPA